MVVVVLHRCGEAVTTRSIGRRVVSCTAVTLAV
jgi:hypothetical protein